MLTLDKVTMQFEGLTAINDFSLDISKSGIYSIIGPNGAGKSTLFNCISRLYTPTSGDILFNGKSLLSLKPYEISEIGIARSFQNVELFERMTVLENLLTGLHTNFRNNIFTLGFRMPSAKREEKEALERAYEVLKLLQIEHLADKTVKELPFGYQKMVDICRAVISNPKLILLDEPAAGMNPFETDAISQLILRLKEEFNYTILLIEHDMPMVMKISDYLVAMNFGEKIAEGLPKDVQQDSAVIAAYLGEEDHQFASS